MGKVEREEDEILLKKIRGEIVRLLSWKFHGINKRWKTIY